MGVDKPVMDKLAEFLHKSGAYSAQQIENEESFGTPLYLHDASEHPDGEHIEEYMLKTFMQELIG
jgi:hypothetical protein